MKSTPLSAHSQVHIRAVVEGVIGKSGVTASRYSQGLSSAAGGDGPAVRGTSGSPQDGRRRNLQAARRPALTGLSDFAHPNFLSNASSFTLDKPNHRFVFGHGDI